MMEVFYGKYFMIEFFTEENCLTEVFMLGALKEENCLGVCCTPCIKIFWSPRREQAEEILLV